MIKSLKFVVVLELGSTATVFAALTHSRHCLNKSLAVFNCHCICIITMFTFALADINMVSSANNITVDFYVTGRSLTYIMFRHGAR